MTERFESPYPGYDILDKWDTPSFNDITRRVYTERLEQVPERRFLDPDQWDLLHAICDRLIPQPEREHPIPIAPWIDKTLADNATSGTRYAHIPPLRQAWCIGLAGIDREAEIRCGRGFRALSDKERDSVLEAIAAGEAGGEHWQDMPPKQFFLEIMLKEAAAIYYAHPAALSEIGFGGPAAPRGYVRLGANRIDPWEAPESGRERARRE